MNRIILSVAAGILFGLLSCQAQWLTQPLKLKSGWNAVYLHVDAAHVLLDDLVGTDLANPVQEIWMWAPLPGAAQFITSPQSPSQPSHWASWVRANMPAATLKKLQPNAAYLVRTTSDFTWNVVGKPVVPKYLWSSSGQNLIGFPTVTGVAAPTFDTFFSPVPELKLNGKFLSYEGGPITSNPAEVLDLSAKQVERGAAYWVSSDSFNRYFGPFELVFNGPTGIHFGNKTGQSSFRLRNNSDRQITVTLTRAASETPPSGQTAIAGQVPVLVRGALNTVNLTYSHASLASGPQSWTLAKSGEAGSEVEVVLGVDRQAMTGAPGTQFASILQFTDSLNYTRIDVGVSATVASNAGLWIGAATVNNVSHYLKNYAKATNSTDLPALLTRLGLAEGVDGFHYEIDPSTSKVLVFGGPQNKTGSYLLDGAIKVDPGTVARSFPLRLILHNDGTTTRLLQKIYYGIGLSSTPVLATKESLLLPSQLASARRVSAVHLPTSDSNIPWNFTGNFQPGSSMSTTLDVAFDDQSSNPFLHTYHPDHDNLDAKFASSKNRGDESYTLRRQITLNFLTADNDFDSLTRGGSTINGSYVEVVSFLGAGTPPARQYDVRGTFVLNRITDIASLTQ